MRDRLSTAPEKTRGRRHESERSREGTFKNAPASVAAAVASVVTRGK